MSEIAIRTSTLPERIQYARALAESNLLPSHHRKNPANVLIAIEYAESFGISAINAINSIFVVDGKPSASADLIAAMVRRAGHKLRVTGDDTYAEASIIRADDPEFVYQARWDMDKARQAGLAGKGPWKQYPAAMLRARAITEVARAGASEALFGVIYTPEELGANVTEDGAVVVDATSEVVPATSGRDWLAEIETAVAKAELDEIWRESGAWQERTPEIEEAWKAKAQTFLPPDGDAEREAQRPPSGQDETAEVVGQEAIWDAVAAPGSGVPA